MNSLEYLRLQLRLEGKDIVSGGLLRQVEAVPGEERPVMVLAQLVDQQVVAYYDESLSPELRKRLSARIQSVAFPKIQPIVDTLRSLGHQVEAGHYKTYVFPANYKGLASDEVKQLSKRDPKVHAFGFQNFAEEIYAIEQDGKIVSACVSTLENPFCGEAWVYTDEQHRHKGFAQNVVRVWANNLIAAKKVPFYSHKVENIASANLAKRLGVHAVFEEIVISYAGNS